MWTSPLPVQKDGSDLVASHSHNTIGRMNTYDLDSPEDTSGEHARVREIAKPTGCKAKCGQKAPAFREEKYEV